MSAKDHRSIACYSDKVEFFENWFWKQGQTPHLEAREVTDVLKAFKKSIKLLDLFSYGGISNELWFRDTMNSRIMHSVVVDMIAIITLHTK